MAEREGWRRDESTGWWEYWRGGRYRGGVHRRQEGWGWTYERRGEDCYTLTLSVGSAETEEDAVAAVELMHRLDSDG